MSKKRPVWMAPQQFMVVTTSRADFGLLTPLLKLLLADSETSLKLVATGMHLSPVFGNTLESIQAAGFEINHQVPMPLADDNENSLCQAISIGITGFSGLFCAERPDAVIVLGDRYELWPVALSAVIHKIPLVHIHGGEATFGLIDDAVRHSVSKMSALHFTSLEQYGQRLIQMGEYPQSVHVVGALGLDTIRQTTLLSASELSERVGLDYTQGNVALVTYHPVTLEAYDNAASQMSTLLEALLSLPLKAAISMPNADTGGLSIYNVIEQAVQANPDKLVMVKHFGQQAYLSALKHSTVMIGNSSSGILESASFCLPTVNIGDRQAGRFKPANVIDCGYSKADILNAIQHALSESFRSSLYGYINPYGDGYSAEKIMAVLKSTDFSQTDKLLKKGFYDLPHQLPPVEVKV